MTRCVTCGSELPAHSIGRPRSYCSVQCRRAEALRLRRQRSPVPAWQLAFQMMRDLQKEIR